MSEPWFHKGLSFGCTGCGACCTGSPGYVWITADDVEQIAAHLKISFEECVKRYTRRVGDRFSLKELPRSYDCVFLKEKKCTIYPVRPKQCRTFPWWRENLETPEHWKEAALRCEGINHPDAPCVPLTDIERALFD
jgi:hypothetical protein